MGVAYSWSLGRQEGGDGVVEHGKGAIQWQPAGGHLQRHAGPRLQAEAVPAIKKDPEG